MPFQRFVETGRVALVSDGPLKGKLVSIVDVIDQTRVLVDGPSSNIPRNQIRLSQLQLTKFRIKFPYTASSRVVRKAWNDAKIDEKWGESMWAKKLADKAKRLHMTDFDRFKLGRARMNRNKIRTGTYLRLKRKATKDGVFTGKVKLPKVIEPSQKKKWVKPAKKAKAAPKK